jgi:hypothetical protein
LPICHLAPQRGDVALTFFHDHKQMIRPKGERGSLLRFIGLAVVDAGDASSEAGDVVGNYFDDVGGARALNAVTAALVSSV